MGDLRDGKEAGTPLGVCSNSASSLAKGLGNGTGAVGGLKPVDLDGLDRARAEGRRPPGTETLEKELADFLLEGGLGDRLAFKLLRMAGVTNYTTYTNVLGVCSEWFHELLTSRDGI